MGLNRIATIGDYTLKHVNALVTTVAPVSPQQINTTATTAIAGAGAATAVAPASMAGIQIGDILAIFGGVGTAEVVTVTSLNATTFTANFANAHSGTYNIVSHKPTRLGALIINTVGTAIIVTLYNGNPNDTTINHSVIATVTIGANIGALPYEGRAEYGLWYTVTGTTAGDYTISYADIPL